MKRKISLFLTMVFIIISFVIPTQASTVNAKDEIWSLQKYYSDNSYIPQTADEIIVFSSVNWIKGTALPDIWDNDCSDIINYSKLILCRLSLDIDVNQTYNDVEPVTYLSDNQQENGTFGSIEDTIWAAIALQSVQAKKDDDVILYSGKTCSEWLISIQLNDGSFYDNIKITGMVLSYLSFFNKDKIGSLNDCITSAENWMTSKLNNDGTFGNSIEDLCWAITGLTDAGVEVNDKDWLRLGYGIQNFKNDDGTYRLTKDGANEFNSQACVFATQAYDSILNKSSYINKLMSTSSYTKFTWKNIKNYIYVFAVLFILSLIFWGFIMFGKKKYTEQYQDNVSDENINNIN